MSEELLFDLCSQFNIYQSFFFCFLFPSSPFICVCVCVTFLEKESQEWVTGWKILLLPSPFLTPGKQDFPSCGFSPCFSVAYHAIEAISAMTPDRQARSWPYQPTWVDAISCTSYLGLTTPHLIQTVCGPFSQLSHHWSSGLSMWPYVIEQIET